jgi:hypothetical protein
VESTETDSEDQELAPEVATYYGHQILLASPPTVYDLNEKTQEYELSKDQTSVEDRETTSVHLLESGLYLTLLLSVVCIFVLNRKSPKQEHTVYIKGLFASVGFQFYLILELHLTGLYFIFIERDIGGHLLYLGFFGLIISLFILSKDVPNDDLTEVQMNRDFKLYFVLIWILFGIYLLGTIVLNLGLMWLIAMEEFEKDGLVGIVSALIIVPQLVSKYLFFYFQKRHYTLIKDSTNVKEVLLWGVPTLALTLIGTLMASIYLMI